MTPDPQEWNRAPQPRTPLEHAVNGPFRLTHDETCAKYEQAWRLMCGAEPSALLSCAEPATHMRYGPYR